MGRAKAGTKLIYNGKIERSGENPEKKKIKKIKKIRRGEQHIYGPESLFYCYAINVFYLFFHYKYDATCSNHSALGTKIR